MKKQLKTLGMGLVLGTAMMAMVGCSSTEETGSTSSNISREEEVNTMLTEVVSGLGELDFGEAYLEKYVEEMTEEEYVVMMTNEINGVVKEEIFINGNNPIDVKEEEINEDSLNLLIETEILNDMQHLENKQIKNDIENVHKETIDEFAVDGDEGISLGEAQERLENYVAEYYPEGCYSEEAGDNGSFRYANVYDSTGELVDTLQFDYQTGEIGLSQSEE